MFELSAAHAMFLDDDCAQVTAPPKPLKKNDASPSSSIIVRAADASCLNAAVTSDELHDCIKRLKRNKSAGIEGILSALQKRLTAGIMSKQLFLWTFAVPRGL